MGVLGEMFPSRKLRSEAGEAGSGQGWRLNPDTGLIEIFPVAPAPVDGPTLDDPALDDPALDDPALGDEPPAATRPRA